MSGSETRTRRRKQPLPGCVRGSAASPSPNSHAGAERPTVTSAPRPDSQPRSRGLGALATTRRRAPQTQAPNHKAPVPASEEVRGGKSRTDSLWDFPVWEPGSFSCVCITVMKKSSYRCRWVSVPTPQSRHLHSTKLQGFPRRFFHGCKALQKPENGQQLSPPRQHDKNEDVSNLSRLADGVYPCGRRRERLFLAKAAEMSNEPLAGVMKIMAFH